jgi:hypothetical protein
MDHDPLNQFQDECLNMNHQRLGWYLTAFDKLNDSNHPPIPGVIDTDPLSHRGSRITKS